MAMNIELYLKSSFNLFPDIAQEKTLQNIEGFDTSKLKHAETAEKSPLPSKAGK